MARVIVYILVAVAAWQFCVWLRTPEPAAPRGPERAGISRIIVGDGNGGEHTTWEK